MKQSCQLLLLFALLLNSNLYAKLNNIIDPPSVTVNYNTICEGTVVTLNVTGMGTATVTWHTTSDGSDAPIGTGTSYDKKYKQGFNRAILEYWGYIKERLHLRNGPIRCRRFRTISQ